MVEMKRFRFSENGGETDSIKIANTLMLLSRGGQEISSMNHKRLFECKTCKRQFPSFQALGGHRASHKKPRLSEDNQSQHKAKPRVHECSVCGVEFAIGQALGGHMRRHRATTTGEGLGHGLLDKSSDDGKRSGSWLDLNLLPSGDGMENRELDLGLGLGLDLSL